MKRRSFLHDICQDNQGLAIIEAALVIPVLLVILVGLTDFSMALFKRLYTEQVAISGTQLAISGGIGPVPDTQIIAQLAADSGLPTANFAITRWTECNSDGTKYPQGPCPNDNDVREDFVKVAVTNSYQPIFKVGMFSLVPSSNFTSSSTGRLQ